MQSDLDLVARVVLAKDQPAFSRLVERHQAGIRAFLRRLTAGDHAAADDLAQETFLAAYTKLHTWQGKAQLATWLHSIAYRKFLERVRREKRFEVMEEVPEPDGPGGLPADAEILAQQLMRLLSPTDRACMTLAYAAGMSHEDISSLADLPLGSVKSRIHRSRLKLQQWLNDNDHSLQHISKTPDEERIHVG